ncbi:MAG: ABC transporter substrate-binding protein [Eggerthellaceae bacterium]|nr:ABC transporter substrate-binding protein [Eggerthellaceae bacterium]
MNTKEPRIKLDRRTFVKGAAAVGVAALAAPALSGCGVGGGRGGTLRYYINQPACIDPFDLQESEGTAVSANLFDSLTYYDYRAQELVGAAAESWEVSDDATVFTFKLREGALFHNGEPVTAQDFKFSWERMCNPNTADEPSVISYHIDKVVGYDAMLEGTATELVGLKTLDELTFEVTLSEPFADFVYVASHPALGPIPSGGAADDFATFSRAPIGNGPFMMDGTWVDDQYIQVKRFDDYYGEKAKIDGCDFLIFKSPDTAFTEFQAGNLDLSMIANGQIESTKAAYGNSVDGYTANPGAQTLMGAESSTYYFVINLEDKFFASKDVRRAVSLAINRQAICDTIFEGSRTPATGIVPPGIEGYRPDAWPYAKYDIEAARQALADAGFPGGEGLPPIKLSCNSGGGHEEIMQMVQADLAAIGIKAELDSMEWASYLSALQNGNYQIGRLGWIADYPIMDNFLYPLFYTDNGDNRSGYSNKEVDEKIIAARAITDTAERIKLYQEVDDILGEDAVVVPVMYYCHHDVASDRVKNLFYGPNRITALAQAELV